MARLEYAGQGVEVREGATVLDALLAEGHEVPNDCRAGACQSCLMQATQGRVPEAAQQGLKDTLKAQRYFLACRCHPEEDLSVRLPQREEVCGSATVIGLEPLAPDIMVVRLRSETPLEYRAGQYLTLWRDATLGRSYSLASVPGLDPHLELHVKKVPGGAMSTWIHDHLQVGEELQVQGPAGDCFYVPGDPEQSLLLAGTGTGLAPLYGIVRDALEAGHRGDIHLLHGARDPSGLYLVDELRALESRYGNLHYHPGVLEAKGPLPDGVRIGTIGAMTSAVAPKLAGWKVFLCGAPDLVNSLRRQVFLAGANSGDIYADAFSSPAAPAA